MRQIRFFATLLLLLTLSSCESVRNLSISYLKPAEVTFPPAVQSVALINNMADGESGSEIKGAALTGQIAQQLANRNFFKEVVLEEELTKKEPLQNEALRAKAEDMKVDYAVVLETISMESSENITYQPQLGAYIGLIKYKVTPQMALMNARNGNSTPLCYSDTILIGEEGSDRASVEHLLNIDKKHASEMVTEKIAEQIVDKLIPAWQTSGRILFIGNSPTMRDGGNYFDQKLWRKAVESWEKDYNSSKKKLKFYAAANIALAYEMADNYRESYEWVKKAEEEVKHFAAYTQYIKFYRTDIEKRLRYSQRIHSQMKRFKGIF